MQGILLSNSICTLDPDRTSTSGVVSIAIILHSTLITLSVVINKNQQIHLVISRRHRFTYLREKNN